MNWSTVPIWHSSESDSEFISVVNYTDNGVSFYSAQPPAIVKGILVALVYFISKRWMAHISLQQVPWFHINFLHAHRNFTFMLCLFPWFCWINTLWKQDVLVWHNTRSGVTFDDNQYCHLYSKRLWAWDITLIIKVQHALSQ